MRRKILVLSFCLLVLATPSSTGALEGSATSPGRMRLKELVQDKREEMLEAMRMKREEFREHLQTIRDQVKRTVVERIDTRMASVNQRVTNRFSAVLDKLQSILNRFVSKAEDAKLKGLDTTALNSAIGSAQIAIDDAKAVVASQTANLYVIEIASESALKVNVGSVVSELRTDLRDVHKMIVDAKQAVQKVVMEFAKLRGSGLKVDNTATGSSQ